jgi:hypothetical protein
LRIYDLSEVETAFRVLQEGAVAGKGVLEVTPDSEVPVSDDSYNMSFPVFLEWS